MINQVAAQNTLDRAGLSSSTLASVAYSVRKLSSTYAGYALRIRRSSDNAAQDIGFTAGGHLDTISLKTFVGSGNGFITTWYDQSGNNINLTQATTSQQPVLVASGVINRENNRPFIRFWGVVSTSHNSLNLPASITTVGHLSSVIRFAAGAYGFILSSTGSYNWHGNSPGSNYLIHSSLAAASVSTGLAWQNGNAITPGSFPWPTSLTVAEFAPATPSSGTGWNNLGNDRNCCHYLSGGSGYSELIVFSAALPAADRQSLENSQENYFAIGITLPVTWSSFSAEKTNSGVDIKWQTASEQNTREFIVQRNNNGSFWTDVAIITAAGNSSDTRQYQFMDRTLLYGMQYYRILQKDIDGKFSYSDTRRIQFESQHLPFVVLNKPAVKDELRILVKQQLSISLYNSAGLLLWTKQFSGGHQSIDLRNFAKGIYFLQANDQTEKIMLE
ncbi:arabinofuranosidase catalytic domain-containing protein [Terrimonas alba]|uniref:arabinofuranosidase catalytic domain-containing protein n=1 Tax=Terrimonas alba TaxID=3349636 RepID=UPI0035F4D42F